MEYTVVVKVSIDGPSGQTVYAVWINEKFIGDAMGLGELGEFLASL